MCVILATIVFKSFNFCLCCCIVLTIVMSVTCTHLIAARVLVHVANGKSHDEPAQVSSVWCVLPQVLLQKEALLVCLEKEDPPLTCSVLQPPLPPHQILSCAYTLTHVLIVAGHMEIATVEPATIEC